VRVCCFGRAGFGSGFGAGSGSGAGAVVIEPALGPFVVPTVVTSAADAWPAGAAEDAKPSMQAASRASVASPRCCGRGGATPAPRLIGFLYFPPGLSARQESNLPRQKNPFETKIPTYAAVGMGTTR